jgi:hypothetical protein
LADSYSSFGARLGKWISPRLYRTDAPVPFSGLLRPVTIQMSPTSQPKGPKFTMSLYPGSTDAGR